MSEQLRREAAVQGNGSARDRNGKLTNKTIDSMILIDFNLWDQSSAICTTKSEEFCSTLGYSVSRVAQ